jgi:hypothetical protein
MKLMEMFSAIGAPKEEDADIDWISDLKFFIDNDNKMLENFIFPVIRKHIQHKDNPDVYKLYMKPIKRCCQRYCEQFEIENPEEKFPIESMIALAKQFADTQKKFIDNGDYDL